MVTFAALGFVVPGLTATQDRPDAAQGLANRGVAYLEQFSFDEAAAEFEAVVALRPDSAPALINLGIAYFNQRRYDEALATLEKRLGFLALGGHDTHDDVLDALEMRMGERFQKAEAGTTIRF